MELLEALGDRLARTQAYRPAYVEALTAGAGDLAILRAEQAAQLTPDILSKVQRDRDALFAALIDAFDLLALGFSSENQALIAQGSARVQEAEAIAKQIQVDAREVLAPCGIRLPA